MFIGTHRLPFVAIPFPIYWDTWTDDTDDTDDGAIPP
jgi:hypothetical protein